MKKTTYILVILLVSCSSKGSFTYKQYKEKHREFHEQHVAAIDQGQNLILTDCESLLANLDTNSVVNTMGTDTKISFLQYKWKNICQATDNFCKLNDTYIHDIIVIPATQPIMKRMADANQKLLLGMQQHENDVEFAIIDGKKDDAKSYINELMKVCNESVGILKPDAEAYLKICK